MKAAAVSSDLIDGQKSYQFRFKFKENTDCVKIGITASYITDTVPPKKISAKTYFIVERSIDLNKFHGKEKMLYTAIGKNYNPQWEQKSVITVCSSDNDPLQRLDAKSEYVMKFTPFSDDECIFQISIQSDTPVIEPE